MDYVCEDLFSLEVHEEVYDNYGNVSHVRLDSDILYNDKETSISKLMKRYSTLFVGKCFSIKESGQSINVGKDFPGEFAYSKSSLVLSKSKKLIKGKLLNNIDEIILNATNRMYSNDHKPKHVRDAKYGFYKYDTSFSLYFGLEERFYTGKIVIRNDEDGKKYLYAIAFQKQ